MGRPTAVAAEDGGSRFLRRNHKNYYNLSKHETFLLLNVCASVRVSVSAYYFLIMCERILSEWVGWASNY